MDSIEGGIMVTNVDESSLVSEVKEKLTKIPVFLTCANVYNQKAFAFEQGGARVLKYQGMLHVPSVDGIQERIMDKAHSSIPFI